MLDYQTTWVGLLGGGVSGSIVAGGSIYQMDIWNMAGGSQPVRVMVSGKRVGAMAEFTSGHALLLVTGCKTPQQMNGVESSGIDWEFALGLKGSAILKTGGKLFSELLVNASATTFNWATHESAKRMAQWAMDDLGVIKPGRQFNLLPTPLSVGVGAGIFYEWQTLSLLRGDIGWQYFSPSWRIDRANGVWLRMSGIPEQDGAKIKIGIALSDWGIDPYIRWAKSGSAGVNIDSTYDYQIVGYIKGGELYQDKSCEGFGGIDLMKLQPSGMLETNLFSTKRSAKISANTKVRIKPVVFRNSNFTYWKANRIAEVRLDSSGKIV